MILPVMLVTALGLLALGVTLPIVTVETLLLIRQPYSILDVVTALFEGGDWLVAAILGVFSLAFPAAKLLLMLGLWQRLQTGRAIPPWLLPALEGVSRWSMLDVLAAAVIVFAVKTRAFTDAHFEPAVYAFVASIALTAGCSLALRRRAQRPAATSGPKG